MNIRSILMTRLSRSPTERQWEELELRLDREVFADIPGGIPLPEALASEPAQRVIADWRHRHLLDD